MKIALTFPACNRRGGVERVLVECANYLAGKGHDTSVLTLSADDGVLDSRVKVHLLPKAGPHAILRHRAFHRHASLELARMRKNGPVVHAAFSVTAPPDGVLWVQSLHAQWLKISQSHRHGWQRLRQRLNPFHSYILSHERRCFGGREYRHLIALTDQVKQDLQNHYGVPEADISILPNGVNFQEFSPARRGQLREQVRSELGYAPSDRVVLFVANELERKGFFPLLGALARLADSGVKLLVAGRVDLTPHMDRIKQLGMIGRIRATGPSADVGRFYAAADLFALPTYYEAWGLVIVEALASGLPVLTSRLAGASITVKEPTTGLLLDDPHDEAEIADKLQRLLTAAPTAPDEISKTVRQYGWDCILEQYERILLAHA